MLVRSWNLFHGNAVPPQRSAFLDQMVQLATHDGPDVLCLQEIPVWALPRFTVGDVAARPRTVSAELGRILTDPNHGLLRSAFTGQGNAIQLAPRLRLLAHRVLVLNSLRFRRLQARELELPVRASLAWARERRIVQAVRVARENSETLLVANLHCTSYARDQRLADAELIRAAWFATSTASPGEPVVLAGDFNANAATSGALAQLTGPEWGFSQPGPGIDHILVKGAVASPPSVWPVERRRVDGRLLSDHAPVEVEIQ